MQSASRKRKERIEALRRAKEEQLTESSGHEKKESKEPVVVDTKYRNYTPIQPVEKSQDAEEEEEEEVPETTVESAVEGVAEAAIEENAERQGEEVDLFQLAPKKIDWDLKRALEPQMEILEKRTQRAIAELIRERLKGEKVGLAEAVAAQQQAGSMEE